MITEQDIELLKSRNWNKVEIKEGVFVQNDSILETLKKPLEEINSNEKDSELMAIWVKRIKEDRVKSLSSFVWNQNDLIRKKVFPMDYDSGLFWFGLLLPKEIDNEQRGQKIGKKQVLSPCLITSDRKLLEFNLRFVEDYKLDFETIPSYLPHRWSLESIREYLFGEDKPVDGLALLEKIKEQYEKYLFIRKKEWYKIYSLWDIGTYLYQIFEAYPLIENRGLAGTGKSKSMTISSFISFNGGQVMANPSESTLFRETEEVKGTKYFDEAEKLWVFNKATKQYEGDVRTELINASYTKEAKVPRQEKINNKFVTKWYSPYSPTQLSSINGLFGATETRAITRICTKSPNDDDRGEREPAEDRHESTWAEIREDCYLFALHNWKEIKDIYNGFPKDCGLKRRDLQIWKPLLSVARFISEETYQEILSFAMDLSKMRLDDLITESSFDYMCLSALRRSIEVYPETDKHYLDRIKEFYCSERGDESENNIYLNRNISQHLKRIGFEKKRDGKEGNYFVANKQLFDEIVAPICPQLAFLSPLSTLSTLNNGNNIKKCVDGVEISVDKVRESGKETQKGVEIVEISVDSVDDLKMEGVSKDKPLELPECPFTKEQLEKSGYTESEIKEILELKGGYNHGTTQ